jgi:hypothetical protein
MLQNLDAIVLIFSESIMSKLRIWLLPLFFSRSSSDRC